MEFKEKLKVYQEKINQELDKYLRKYNCPEKVLNDSMEYSLMAGGKRLRPILVMATFEIFEKQNKTMKKQTESNINEKELKNKIRVFEEFSRSS